MVAAAKVPGLASNLPFNVIIPPDDVGLGNGDNRPQAEIATSALVGLKLPDSGRWRILPTG